MRPNPDLNGEAVDRLIAAAKAAQFKSVDELDETERTAIAILAGAEYLADINDDGLLRLRTRYRVGIYKADGKFNVVEANRPKGMSLNG